MEVRATSRTIGSDTGVDQTNAGTYSQAEADAEDERLKACGAQLFQSTLSAEEPVARHKREFFAFVFDRDGSGHSPTSRWYWADRRGLDS